MKWRLLTIAILAILTGMLFVPGQRWWAAMALVLIGGGMYYERRERHLGAKAVDKYEEEEGNDRFMGMGPFLICELLAFAIGMGWSLLNGLKGWSFGVGVLNIFGFVVTVLLSHVVSGEIEHQESQEPKPAPSSH